MNRLGSVRLLAHLRSCLWLPVVLLAAKVGATAVIYTYAQTHARPVSSMSHAANTDPLCRFGANTLEDPTLTNLPVLGAGWYMDFGATQNPSRPAGIEYVQVIRISPSQSGPGYTYSPNGSNLLQVVASNPGAKWLISNEPDSIWQDKLLPAVYASAYHELYYLLKSADPSARVIAGSIVQATSIRLQYLDQILTSYYGQFQSALPSDGWSIHNYILNEVSCNHDPLNCWGAEIPPGISAPYGEIWGLKDTDRLDIFVERIVRFRQWMADRGYKGQPLYLTEYGVLMPSDFSDENGQFFTEARVNAFMDATFDYMRAATHPLLGDPLDEYRLVQQWSWYSTTDVNYNGVLFDSQTYQPTSIGANYANYTAAVGRETDLYATAATVTSVSAFSKGEPITLTLTARVANSGNLAQPATATVRFYDGPPSGGGSLIGAPLNVQSAGCGQAQSLSITWPNLPPGKYDVYVEVTPGLGVNDADMSNNVVPGPVLVGTHHNFLPVVRRSLLPPGG